MTHTTDRNPRPLISAGTLLGIGLGGFFDGILFHHLLHVHHVVERLGVSIYDYAFLASGVILILAGYFLIRAGLAHSPSPVLGRGPG